MIYSRDRNTLSSQVEYIILAIVMIYLRESNGFCCHIAKIMVYGFLCNGWREK